MLVITAFIFTLLLLTKPVMASSSSSLFMDPSTGTFSPNISFPVKVTINVGSLVKLNVAQITLNFDPTLIVNSCQAATGFQGIGGRNPCVQNGNTLKIVVESATSEGPSGEVAIANLVLQNTLNGRAGITLSSPQVVVKQTDGTSVLYPITQLGSSDYQISQASTTTIPTVTIVTASSTPFLSPTSSGSQSCTKPSKPDGNANGDCFVNEADYAIWLSEFIGTNQTKNADFDGNGKVNLVDYELWRRNKV